MSKRTLYLDLDPETILVIGDRRDQVVVTVQEKKGRKSRLKIEAADSRTIFTISSQSNNRAHECQLPQQRRRQQWQER
jgi:hypothetical protein